MTEPSAAATKLAHASDRLLDDYRGGLIDGAMQSAVQDVLAFRYRLRAGATQEPISQATGLLTATEWRPPIPLHVYAVLIGLDVLANALIGGGAYQTISCRIGLSIRDNGWASRVRWPAWWTAHCLASVYEAIV
jgi:hypothetical protein